MTELDLDRDLRAIFAAGPQTAPEPIVDRALAAARATGQRKPRIARLDTRAWPPQARSVTDPSVHRTLRVLAVAAVLLLLAAVVAIGARLLDRPPSVTIVTAGTLDAAVHGPRLALWPDGRILVEGENGDRYLFSPTTGTTEPLSFGPDWDLARADILPDGRVVLTQRRDSATGGQVAIDVAVYHRTTGTVQPVGSFDTPWFAAATLVLRDGRILISGGVLFPSDGLPCSPLVCEGAPSPAPTPTYETSEGAKDTVGLFDPATGSTTEIGHLQVARFQHQMVELEDGRILVVGGGDYTAYPAGDGEALEVEVFDLATGSSKVVGSLGPGRLPFMFPPVTLDDGRILLPEAAVSEFPCGIPSYTPGLTVDPEQVWRIYHQPTRLFDPSGDRLVAGPMLPHYASSYLVPEPGARALAFGSYEVVPGDCARRGEHTSNPWLGVADIGRNVVFETYNPMTGIASLDVVAPRAYGAAQRLPDGRVALISDDPNSGAKNAIDIVTIEP